MPMVKLGEWLPDRSEVMTPGLLQIYNALPVADGYNSIRQVLESGRGALDSICRGADAARSQNGTEYIVAGTESKLWLSTGSDFSDESKVGGYTTDEDQRWDFALYGDLLLGTNLSEPVQQWDLDATPTTFTDLDADASLAAVIESTNEFVMLGNIDGQNANSAIGRQEAGLHWCAIGNPASWPEVGTDAAINVESDYQILEGDGGPITDIVAAEEYTAIFRERQVWRGDYVGGSKIWAFRKMDDHRGCVFPGTAVAVGNNVYFASQEGFYVFNGASVVPIGHEKVDRWWRDRVAFNYLSRASSIVSSEFRSILWAFPSVTSYATEILGYQYDLGRWFTIYSPATSLVSTVLSGLNMDETPKYGDWDMDDVADLGNVNLDTLTGTPERVVGYFSTNHKLYSYTDPDNYQLASIETGTYEVEGQRRGLLRSIRPVFSGSGEIYAFAAGRNVLPGTFNYDSIGLRKPNGRIPMRVGGRYLRAGFYMLGKVKNFQGYDATLQIKGKR